jgi:hypothetical protein
MGFRYGSYEEASKRANEQSRDPDFMETTDMEAIPVEQRGRHAIQVAKAAKKERRLRGEVSTHGGEESSADDDEGDASKVEDDEEEPPPKQPRKSPVADELGQSNKADDEENLQTSATEIHSDGKTSK